MIETMKAKKKMIRSRESCDCAVVQPSTSARIAEIGVMMIVLVAVYQASESLNLFSFNADTENVIGLGTVLLIGLTASTSSCLAMVGGLLLSVTSAWSKAHPKATSWEKFEPQLHFNLGRLLGYYTFGGLTGLLGQQLLLTVHGTGMLKIALSALMIILGLNILGFIPKRFCRVPLPKPLLKRIRGLSTSDGIGASLGLGSLTYFIPCGFTQSMQLLALASGNFWAGSSIMFVFALGTLPSLLGIGALSSFAQGKMGRIFVTFAGTVSLLLGFSNLQNGLLLSGVNLALPSFTANVVLSGKDPNVSFDKNGQQIISVGVATGGYSAESFTIKAGVPTWIYALAPEPVTGCISSMTIPDFNMSRLIRKGENWLGPITPTKDFAFMCSMGMFKADVHVKS